MVLGCRYTLPPIDMAALATLYGDVSGETTRDMCVRVLYSRTRHTGTPVDTVHRTTCVEMEDGRPTPVTVIGMEADTEYQLSHEYVRVVRPQPADEGYQFTLTTGPHYIEPSPSAASVLGVQGGERLTYTTRKIPKAVTKVLAKVEVDTSVSETNVQASASEPYLMWCGITQGTGKMATSFATDLNGNVVFYHPYYKGAFLFSTEPGSMITRPAGRGNWFIGASGGSSLNPDLTDAVQSQVFAEIDPEGVPLWSLTLWELNDKLLEAGHNNLIAEVLGHHDSVRLANGDTILFGGYNTVDKSKAEYIEYYSMWNYLSLMGVADHPVPLDYVKNTPTQHYDMMLQVSGTDHSIKQVWKASEHIAMTYEEQDAYSFNVVAIDLPGMSGDPIYYGDVSGDRTHMNSIFYDPSDGDILVSVRSQDRVYKLNWSGDDTLPWGDPVYNLRDFALFDEDYTPITTYDDNLSLFSHQHCAEMYAVEGHPELKVITLFDNSNKVAYLQRPDEEHHSNALAVLVNEEKREMVLLFRKALLQYAFAVGTSQALANGNFHYHVGVQENKRGKDSLFNTSSQVYELSPEGDFIYSIKAEAAVYRAWRLTDLYAAVDYKEVDFQTLPIPQEWM
ncbi:arylsulfotransferase [Kipferlia bialata]|uniref:Arylsulfotransferase n=1 Tax=Kipferlia bialata TaxID=797122 RepID=A0A9K3GK83_9EUKA|nr:arylsulfotransferase [Kipferlia bialata]|eukprot:g6966.t1